MDRAGDCSADRFARLVTSRGPPRRPAAFRLPPCDLRRRGCRRCATRRKAAAPRKGRWLRGSRGTVARAL